MSIIAMIVLNATALKFWQNWKNIQSRGMEPAEKLLRDGVVNTGTHSRRTEDSYSRITTGGM
jgi:hypothetical protein